MPIYVERTILDLPRLYINGGARGFLVGIAPADLVRVLKPTPVEVGITGPGARD
jgi:prolyl-tRNA editing enzyme YbaK/EbsC (Cys-tRNA(Pro) deacylase)